MDNITHTVVGLFVGELTYQLVSSRLQKEEPMPGRGWFWFIGAAANNFPDLDLVLYNQLPDPLGYLLHHRGHTHTMGGAILESVMIFALCILFGSFRELWRSSKSNRTAVMGLAFGGLLMHLGFDSFNSYGVHPFYPFSAEWFYGDVLFIIEPMLWFIFGIPFALCLEKNWSKAIWFALILFVPVGFAFNGIMPWLSAALMWLVAGGFFLVRKNKTMLMRAALGAFFVFIASQFAFSHFADNKLIEVAKTQFPGERILENAMTPLPANPLCWQFVSISVKETSNEVTLRRGNLTLAPNLYSSEECQLKTRAMPAEINPLALTESAVWFRVHRDTITGFQDRTKDCHNHAWLRFARMPAFTQDAASDWRFLSQGDNNFTTMRYKEIKKHECPRWVPPWIPPRQDLIEFKASN